MGIKMSIEPTVILSRLKFMADNLRELRRFESITLEEYLSSYISVASIKKLSLKEYWS